MKVKRTIVMSLDILNVHDIYSPMKSSCIKTLKHKFARGACHKGTFVHKILDVTDAGNKTIDKNRNDGCAIVSVRFEALCISYSKGEIIPNLTITQVSSGDGDFTSGYVMEDDNKVALVNITMQERQVYSITPIAPVIVLSVSYTPGQPITISAIEFKPMRRKVHLMVCAGTLSDEEVDYLNERIKHIREIISEIEKFDKSQITMFSKLLYPYSKHEELKIPSGFKKINIVDLKEFDSNVALIKPIQLGYASTEFLVGPVDITDIPDEFSSITGLTINKEHIAAGYNMLLDITELELTSLYGMVKYYPKEEYMKNKTLFSNFMQMKTLS
jgi:hypothetical protein